MTQSKPEKNTNPFKSPLEQYFNRLIELRHIAYHVSNMLNNSIRQYEKASQVNRPITMSALIISDITGPTDNGWTINFHSGASKMMMLDTYKDDIKRIISNESCYAFAQSFEALERFCKNLIFEKTQLTEEFQEEVIEKWKSNDREKYKGGDDLFKMLKKACGPQFHQYSNKNNYNLRFKKF